MEEGLSLDLTVAAEANRLGELREQVAAFARALGADESQVGAIVLAVNEACSNVVRHAYGPGGGPLHLEAVCEGRHVQFLVSDNGTPVADPDAGGGARLGLAMIREVSDDVDVEGPGPSGTKVRMTFALKAADVAKREIPDSPSPR